MDARQVQQQLFDNLRTRKQFVSSSVLEKEGEEYVLVRLLDDDFQNVRRAIPKKVSGVKVMVEKSGPAIAFGLR